MVKYFLALVSAPLDSAARIATPAAMECVAVSYRLSETWSFGLGGRYESLRFRLDDKGPAPDGVGEDRSIPVYVSATYARGWDLRFSAVAGMELNGELRLEDSGGRRLAQEDYESTPFLGATFDVKFRCSLGSNPRRTL